MMWEARAKEVEEVYGGYVDWEEAFYICPECEEPIYKCDWDENALTSFLCPICNDGYIDEWDEWEHDDKWDEEEDDDEFD